MVLVYIIVANFLCFSISADEDNHFDDVPMNHWSERYIEDLRVLGITDGVGNNTYGFGRPLTREAFVAFLGKLNDWKLIRPETGSFIDNTDRTSWSYSFIETALMKGIIEDVNEFRPKDMITREEMAVMIINSLGYKNLAENRSDYESPFDDVTLNAGYISMLKDFGIVTGKSEVIFDPYGNATREEAAAILMRMYDRLNATLDETNAFYAVQSNNQRDLMASFDTISFGWSQLSASNYNDLGGPEISLSTHYPSGYQGPIEEAKANGNRIRLSIYADDMNAESSVLGVLSVLMKYEDKQASLIDAIIDELNGDIGFDGVVIDFESLRGDDNRVQFVGFLRKLSQELDVYNKSLTVMVHPSENYDGYDYANIVEIADEMIVMAHDYNAKYLNKEEMAMGYSITPVAPINSVYTALADIKASVDNQLMDRISLQLSFSAAQWVKNPDGTIKNSKRYNPLYSDINSRLLEADTRIDYGITTSNPYATFVSNGLENILWYEDSRSIEEKIKLAKMFGIQDISIWRLGNIPNYPDGNSKEVYMDTMILFE